LVGFEKGGQTAGNAFESGREGLFS
jgi:hypothetical protein